ncbi:hypothetical protein [Streptomyces sp. Je 1-332]|uniref:hypothetical protein n=1 Tax=Streptomyces sp. Je 1-332 TaxID=3231270 RepID=UPI003459D942
MSQEAVPEQEAARETSVPEQQGPPKGLLQQMEELMAALNADLTQLDADLQQSTTDGDTTTSTPRPPADDTTTSTPRPPADDTAPPAPRPSTGDEPTRF